MMFIKVVFCIIFIFYQCGKVLAVFNQSAYKSFPPLYTFDDYDKCLRSDDAGIQSSFCIVYAEIVPNAIPLWRHIDNYSSDYKHHYRHDRLFFGVCLDRCRHIIPENFSGLIDIEDEEIKTYYTDVYNTDDYYTSIDRQNLSILLYNCLNRDFQDKYNLSLRTFIEYCEMNSNEFHWDVWHTLCTISVTFIVVLVIISSLYDFLLKRRQPLSSQNNDFYKQHFSLKSHNLLTSFSICRNYYRLNRVPLTKIELELQFLDGVRVISMFLVMMAHVVVVFMIIHIQNPEFIEQFFYRVDVAIIENGTVIIQVFFFMSGFLLYMNFRDRDLINTQSEITDCLKNYFQLTVYRFLRLAPSIGILLLFTASFMGDLQDGPFWRHMIEAERRFCRDYWWKSLLLQNNIFDMRKNCLHHTWYVATDMQLFAVFLPFIIVISKYPRTKKALFAVLFALSVMIPALVTYFQELDAFFITNPESYRYLYFKNTPTQYGSYLPFYTNMAGSFFGIWFADKFLQLRTQKTDFNSIKLNILWWLVFPLAFALLISGFWFMETDFKRPSIWEALYAGAFRNVWSFMMGLFILGSCFRVGWIGFEFLNLNLFRVLARISYQSYLWHTIVIRVLMGHYRAPLHVNRLLVFSNIIATLLLTYIVAYFVALFWEYPIAEIMRCVFKQKREKPKDPQASEEVIVLSHRVK